VERGGVVSMEAEKFSSLESRNDAPIGWTLGNTGSGYLGSGYMHVPDGESGALSSYASGARILYEVDFSNLGSYRIYVRRRSLGTAANSAYAGIDGSQSTSVDNGGVLREI